MLHPRRPIARCAHAALIALGIPGFILAAPSICEASDLRLALHVTRSAGADDCPDTIAVGAAVARALGRNVRGPAPDGTADVHVEIAFAHRDSRYVATVKATSARVTDERTIAHTSSTCASLADAVASAVGQRLDENDELDDPTGPAAEAGPGSSPSLPPLPAPPSAPAPAAAPDPDDIPPRGKGTRVEHLEAAGRRSRWYGWQILAADAASTGLIVGGGFVLDSGPRQVLETIGVSGYVLGGPIVHAAGGRWGKALVSLGLRISLPILGEILGETAGPSCTVQVVLSSCEARASDRALLGSFVGLAMAITIDVAALSWDKVPAPTADTASTRPTLHLAPTAFVFPQPGGGVEGMVGLVGSL